MAVLNHAVGEKFIEARMIDRCTITRDKEQVFDAVLDEATGELVEPVPDSVTVYSGKCLVKEADSDERVEGGYENDAPTHVMLIPKKASNIRYMDRVRVSSQRDAGFTGSLYEVTSRGDSTHSTYRKVLMRRVLHA